MGRVSPRHRNAAVISLVAPLLIAACGSDPKPIPAGALPEAETVGPGTAAATPSATPKERKSASTKPKAPTTPPKAGAWQPAKGTDVEKALRGYLSGSKVFRSGQNPDGVTVYATQGNAAYFQGAGKRSFSKVEVTKATTMGENAVAITQFHVSGKPKAGTCAAVVQLAKRDGKWKPTTFAISTCLG